MSATFLDEVPVRLMSEDDFEWSRKVHADLSAVVAKQRDDAVKALALQDALNQVIGAQERLILQLQAEIATTHKRHAEANVNREADELNELRILADEVEQRHMTDGKPLSNLVRLECETDSMPYRLPVREQELLIDHVVYRWKH